MKRPFTTLFTDRNARVAWDEQLTWYRLRYDNATGPAKALRILSRPGACGRVTLRFVPSAPLSYLYLGVPAGYETLVAEIAADYAFSAQQEAPAESALQPLAPAEVLGWDRPFLAHLVDGHIFLATEGGRRYLPRPEKNAERPDHRKRTEWSLLSIPPPGVALTPAGERGEPPARLLGAGRNRWPLGLAAGGQPLSAPGQINVYGRQDAVAAWLVEMVTTVVRADLAGLVVLDGAGDLAPALKRREAVTRLLGNGLTYLDLDEEGMEEVFNPLAPAPGETETATYSRWRTWFEGMNVSPAGLDLLASAQEQGVESLSGLHHWLKRPGHQSRMSAAAGLTQGVERLLAGRDENERGQFPSPFAALPAGALFLTCRATRSERQQRLYAALLAAAAIPGTRLVVHGFPWQEISPPALDESEQIVIGNGPPLADAPTVLTMCSAQAAAALSSHFFDGAALRQETLELLGRGEGLIYCEEKLVNSSWRWPGQNQAEQTNQLRTISGKSAPGGRRP